ncbi:subtilisin AprE [soil metagenome]
MRSIFLNKSANGYFKVKRSNASPGVNLRVIGFLMIIFMAGCKKSATDTQATADATLQQSSLKGNMGINVVLTTTATSVILTELNLYGNVQKQLPAINALTMNTTADNLAVIRKLPYVIAANPDAERKGSPVDAVVATNFANGLSTWNLDAINVTNLGVGRTVAQDGTGVYVGVLDTGLPDSWRQYFPQERIATQYAKSFGGGGGENGNVSEQPNKWEHDQSTHGGHVTSTIIGFQLGSVYFNGVAPKSTIIPVKVLNQNGSGWSSVIAEGILYLTSLKMGALNNAPVVINMSLGGPSLDAMEKAAIDYAVSKGVIVVAAAGNEGTAGMGYPGAYQPVISVAAAGWLGQWATPTWWYAANVPDPTNINDFYIADFSSRQKAGQDLDVTAPGAWEVGPFQVNSGQISYYYLSGTSMATPHVAGIVALMAQKKLALTAAEAETILQNAAIPMPAGSRNVRQPDGSFVVETWGADAAGSGFITADAAINGTP